MRSKTSDYNICETEVSLRNEKQPQAIQQNIIHKRVIKIS